MSRFRTSGRSIFDLITSEHQFVQSTYQQIKSRLQDSPSSEDHAAAVNLAFMLIRDLSIHSHKEEILVYPLLSKVQLSSSESQPSHACHEHVLVERQLAALETELEHAIKLGTPAVSQQAMQMLDAMMQDLLHHIEEEEKELLPALQQQLGEDEAIRLGREWEALNGRVATRPHPELPTLGQLAAAANAAQAPLDTLQDEARFKHYMPTTPGTITADALTPYEQQKLNMAQPTPGPNVSAAPFHADAPNPSDLAGGMKVGGEGVALPHRDPQALSEGQEKQTEMEMA